MAGINNTHYFNGIKAVNINNLPDEAWQIIRGDTGDSASGVMDAYKTVPFFRRCIDIRAAAVSRMPRAIMRGDQEIDEADIPELENLNKLLYQIETALVLYGYAYLFKFENRLSENIGLRWLAPKSIKPVYDKNADGDLAYFDRILPKRGAMRLEIDEVVYFWTPAIDTERGPGPSVAEAALGAADVLAGTTSFSAGFFERGAVYPMLLSVEGNPPREEMDKLETWWKRLTRGVKDAWNTIAIRASVKPEIIGPPIKDMEMKGMTDTQRENIATALGVPHSMVLSNAANFATANRDALNFYELTAIPQAELIAEVINDQYLDELGLELVFQPKRLEVFEAQNLESGGVVVPLLQSGIIDQNEARDIIGYEPIDTPQPEPIIMQLPVSEDAPEDEGDEMRRVDLEKWQRKALSSLKSTESAAAHFESDHISYSETQQIVNELALCFSPAEVKAVFDERTNASH